ncbi:hypothetical protein CPCC7001_1594 [Cyanobium sp. PCC 7001]|uniref:hypothetical protein n=1 Tax=Cyanobium sp. PCC 7001 TaxID=180281 RepID=UPI0001804CD2|nr:hypothetical protein [Cyanobium sp. PCC 7001]EDY38715.1 hypothetical protein CPCC7001_1594 [Cyanobium sp. PCC 7001]
MADEGGLNGPCCLRLAGGMVDCGMAGASGCRFQHQPLAIGGLSDRSCIPLKKEPDTELIGIQP